MKTIPILLLTLAAYSPCGHAAPAAVNPASTPATNDAEAGGIASPPGSPTIGYEPPQSPTFTLFFTPAVFQPNYYSQPTPATLPSSDDEALLKPEAAAAAPEPAAVPEPTAPSSSPVSSVAPEPSSDSKEIPSTAPLADATSVSSAQSGDATLVLTMSSSAVTLSVPTGHITASSLGSSSHYTMPTLPAKSPQPSEGAKSESQQAQMSRKAAILGTILAVSSLLGISVFTLCMRCRVPRKLRDRSSTLAVQDSDAANRDPEKAAFNEKVTSASPTPSQQSTAMPTLTSDAPPTLPQVEQDKTQWNAQHPEWHNSIATGTSEYEDVTHILSEGTFAPLSESERSSAATDTSNLPDHRTSHGAASTTASSYATRESQYSHPSTRASQGGASVRSLADTDTDGGASTEYHSISPSGSAPSLPDSPVLRTPKQPAVCTVTRTRSRTVTEPHSPRVGGGVANSKSVPVRLSDGDVQDLVGRAACVSTAVSEESEWDIAAAYAARHSKGSVGARTTISEEDEAAQEHMETIDIGGRNCVLVTGYAF